jgi:hypothetical protein
MAEPITQEEEKDMTPEERMEWLRARVRTVYKKEKEKEREKEETSEMIVYTLSSSF